MAERVSTRAKNGSDVDAPPSASKRRPSQKARAGGWLDEGVSFAKTKKQTKRTIALVYDFDGTLSPKPMQEYSFLPQIGVSPQEFWSECTRVAREQNADPLITYMHLMYKKARDKGLRIDRAALVKQGRAVELYPGVEDWFAAINVYVKKQGGPRGDGRTSKDDAIEVKHYLVSSGLTEIIEGTKIFRHFANVFASEYWFEAYDIPFPKRVITDTGKTQYLFRINKGVENHFESINAHMPEAARPIPFSNMIYFGDGETDVPSMALLKKNGGHAIAVHTPPEGGQIDKGGSPSARKDLDQAGAAASHGGISGGAAEAKCVELFRAGRCDFYAVADYRQGSDLWKRTTLLLDAIIAQIRVRQEAGGLG